MKNETLKSIVALIAGFAALVILSIATDTVLEKAGIMKIDPFNDNPVWLILIIIGYRTAYSIFGCYLAARLAPKNPMKHALILGAIGVVLTTIGTIVMWDVPPHWYPISLAVLTMPAAWVGGRLGLRKG